MNPQEHGGVPPHQFQEPHLPPQVTPHAPVPEPWVQPTNSGQPNNTAGPEPHYAPPTPTHAAGQQYDFIMNPGNPVKKSLLPGGNSTIGRILFAAAGLMVLVVIVAIVMSALGGKGFNEAPLVTVAQDQTELIRIAKLGSGQAVSQTAQNAVISLKLSLTSANQELLSYLATNHAQPNASVLALKRDHQIDTQLSTATAASNFDSVFISVVQTQLATYQHDLKSAYAANPGPKGRQLLSNEYKAAGLLLAQSKQ